MALNETKVTSNGTPSTTSAKAWVLNEFEGGWSIDEKIGLKYSHFLLQSLNFRDKPSALTVLPQPQREDAGTVQDLIQNEVQVQNGTMYSMGSNGYIYERNTSGVWSTFGNIRNGYFGMDYRQDLDSVYLCSDKTVSLMNPISTGPTLDVDYYGTSVSMYNNNANEVVNVNANQTGSSLTTAILTTSSQSSNNVRYFQSDIEPLVQVAFFFTATTNTGTTTATVYDGLNNVLGSVVVNNSSLKANQWNNFTFGSQIRISVAPAARTYHIGLVSTATGNVVSSSVSNQLSSCDLQIWADRLIITSNGLHPMANFQQYECIGNERYLSVWEPLGDPSPDNTEWQRHALQFPPYYQVCGLSVFNDYLAIACERIAATPNSESDGIIFFWDGLAQTYNYFMIVPEGSPLAICTHKNVLYYFAGSKWYAMTSPTSVPVGIRKMPNSGGSFSSTTTNNRINPYAVDIGKSTIRMAWPSTTTNTNIPFGVYSYGSNTKDFDDSFGLDYLLSTGSTNYSNTNNLTIGMVKSFGDLLHVSWRDSTQPNGFGIDYINNTSPPVKYSTIESTIFDNGYPGKQKLAAYMEATWVYPLISNVSFVLKYNIDRQGWIYSNGATTPTVTGSYATVAGTYTATQTWQDGDGYARFDIGESNLQEIVSSIEPGRFHEIQIGLDIWCSGALTSPEITSLSLVFDPMGSESLL